MRKAWSVADTPYPKKTRPLPSILSPEEVVHLIDLSHTRFHRMVWVPSGHLPQQLPQPALSEVSSQRRHRWLQARRQELLPTRYVHVVSPHELAPLALQNKKLLYHLLLQTSATTLLEVARDPKHLGAEIGFFSVLHTCLLRACGPRSLMKIF
jgi:hypothetical protein